MQLISPFTDEFQAYHPYHPQIEAQRPSRCPLCGCPKPEGKGVYTRWVRFAQGRVQIDVRRLHCRNKSCGVTISLLPPFCVPFKHYAAEVVESCLEWVLRRGLSIRQWCRDKTLTDRSTAGSWVRQFVDHSGLLITEGAARAGFSPCGSGSPARGLWAGLRRLASGAAVLPSVQPALSAAGPRLGLFRAPL